VWIAVRTESRGQDRRKKAGTEGKDLNMNLEMISEEEILVREESRF
jgi:hypothetical protein